MKVAPFLLALPVMGLSIMALAVTMPAAVAQPPSPEKLFTAGADIPALIAKAKADQTSPSVNSAVPILTLNPYRVLLEYRTGVTPPAIHRGQAEMIQVLKGAAILATGGRLIDSHPRSPGSTMYTGTSIVGASKRRITAGDYVMIPPDTPHQFQDIHGEFVIISIHPIMPEK